MVENISWHVWLGVTTTIIPATILVALRFAAQTFGPAAPGLKIDDWLILASLMVNWVMAALRYAQVTMLGLGRHADTIPYSLVSNYQKSFLAVQELYFLNALLTKCSLLYLYRRIFGISKKFQAALWGTGFLVASWFVICVIISIFGCDPISYFWWKHQTGHCIDEVSFFRFNGISNMILDILVLCLPIPMVWKLSLGKRQKAAVSGMFLLGSFVCLVSIFRITEFEHSNQGDPTWTTANTGMWSSVEQSVGIMCCCLPTLRPLFRVARYGERQGSSARRSTIMARDSIYKSARGTTFSMATGPSDHIRLESVRENPSLRESDGDVAEEAKFDSPNKRATFHEPTMRASWISTSRNANRNSSYMV